MAGMVKSLTADWIVLDHGGEGFWIARSVVLLLQVNRSPAPCTEALRG